MTTPHPGNKLATQIAIGGAVGAATFYVARRYLFTPKPVEYPVEPGSEQAPYPPVGIETPSGVGYSSYQGPTSSPWFSNAITVPVQPVDNGNTGGTNGGTNTDPGTNNSSGTATTNWGAAIGGDEFNYTGAPNPGLWGVYDGQGHNGHGRRVPSAWDVRDGICTCTGRSNGDTGGMAYKQFSGTKYRAACLARMFPTGGGSGDHYHTAIGWWPDAENWPFGGEDDCAENDIGDGTVHTFIHHSRATEGSQQSHASRSINPAEWHEYAIERSSQGVKTWIDGMLLGNFTLQDLGGPLPGSMHPFLQLDWVDKNGETVKEAKLQFQWFRIFAAP